jgi:hypothetical protein
MLCIMITNAAKLVRIIFLCIEACEHNDLVALNEGWAWLSIKGRKFEYR